MVWRNVDRDAIVTTIKCYDHRQEERAVRWGDQGRINILEYDNENKVLQSHEKSQFSRYFMSKMLGAFLDFFHLIDQSHLKLSAQSFHFLS